MSLLNNAAVTKEVMQTATRYKKGISQISRDWKDELEQDVRLLIFRKVMAHQKGKTLKVKLKTNKNHSNSRKTSTNGSP